VPFIESSIGRIVFCFIEVITSIVVSLRGNLDIVWFRSHSRSEPLEVEWLRPDDFEEPDDLTIEHNFPFLESLHSIYGINPNTSKLRAERPVRFSTATTKVLMIYISQVKSSKISEHLRLPFHPMLCG
jgi:hypothetical protein